jgi:hypothetical protein
VVHVLTNSANVPLNPSSRMTWSSLAVDARHLGDAERVHLPASMSSVVCARIASL